MLPLLSRANNVTVLTPVSPQANEATSSHRLSIPQLSNDRLSICAAVTETLPRVSRYTTRSRVHTTGARVSSTVTDDTPVPMLPLLSRTDNVTVLAPVLLQSNEVTSSHRLSIPQLSEDALSTCAGNRVA